MSIRWKLLALLLAVSLVPVLLLRVNGQRTMRKLGDELSTRVSAVLVERARSELKRLVEDHARVLDRERQLLRLSLLAQAGRMEWVLSGGDPVDAPRWGMGMGHMRGQGMGMMREHMRDGGRESGEWRDGGEDEWMMGHMRLPPGASQEERESASRALSEVQPELAALRERLPDLVAWQWTVLGSGAMAVHPAPEKAPSGFLPRQSPWYRRALESEGPVWSGPLMDPITGKGLVFVISSRLSEGDENGVTALSVPAEALFHLQVHLGEMSEDLRPYLVEPGEAEGEVRVIATPDGGGDGRDWRGRWRPAEGTRNLRAGERGALEAMRADLLAGRSGVGQADVPRGAVIWAYAPAGGTSLLLEVPREDVTRAAESLSATVTALVGEQIRSTGVIVAGVLALIILLSVFLSRRMTADVSRLDRAARRLAEGDFEARSGVSGGDEVGRLGETFDRMVPALEERVRIKESLDVAREVQANLLPHAPPEAPGWQLAGRSLYCEETGGDFYDYLGFPGGRRLAVVGDVSGHGLSAALLMATSRAFLRGRAHTPDPLDTVTAEVNRLLVEDAFETGQFVTMLAVELGGEGELYVVRAGHEPCWLLDPESGEAAEAGEAGPALGIMEDASFTLARARLQPGMTAVAATDGAWECRSPDGEMYGKERFLACLRRSAGLSPEELVEAVMAELESFRGGKPPEDDITLLAVRRTG
ncbi:SpoIIE family protein phosphatase [Desulfohalovibrio reitneri]|uniref:SpoIIE family protein phosphatase n=1 Tax=Desulfohalovibrio reitneri TaxID=1307759 RepID=UPI0004A7244B|nr:SpoIIE family protein phosphatase [Desulfohalovibrio reitneri]